MDLTARLLALRWHPLPPLPADRLAWGLPAHTVLSGAGLPSPAFPANIFDDLFFPLTMTWCVVAS